jgi:hypothetical protein
MWGVRLHQLVPEAVKDLSCSRRAGGAASDPRAVVSLDYATLVVELTIV